MTMSNKTKELLSKYGKPAGNTETEEQRELVKTKTFIEFCAAAKAGKIKEGNTVRTDAPSIVRVYQERGQFLPADYEDILVAMDLAAPKAATRGPTKTAATAG